MSDEQDPLLTVGKAAKYVGVSRQRMYELTQKPREMGQQIGGVWFFRQSELDAYKADRASKNDTALASPARAV
jgi:excisionase family DNA binding protein